MKTIIHEYSFWISDPNDKIRYEQLVEKLKGLGLECFETHGGGSHYHGEELDGREIELETKHLFDNQWNTAPIEGVSDKGLRVFDWAQDYQVTNKQSKKGHWLEQTDEMREVRAHRWICGYTGKQIDDREVEVPAFNLDALGGEHLEEKDLKLIRFFPVVGEREYPELTDEEKAWLLPLYREAQTLGRTERDKERIAKKREKILKERDKAIANANAEFDGFTWLMDRGINTDNVIFYDHTGRFNFGWRKSITGALKEELLKALEGFPFPYDIEEKSKY